MRLLTPTENRRFNELIGFLGITLAISLVLALLSYSPRDASFNVSAQTPEVHPSRNWIGPAGAYTADFVFQLLGYAAFLLPMVIFGLGVRWFRSRPLESAIGALIGYVLLILSLPALLSLWSLPDVRDAIPPGGFFGEIIASGLQHGFNSVGAQVVSVAGLIAALLLTTPFSFAATHALLRAPVNKLDPIGRIKARERFSACHPRTDVDVSSNHFAADSKAEVDLVAWLHFSGEDGSARRSPELDLHQLHRSYGVGHWFGFGACDKDRRANRHRAEDDAAGNVLVRIHCVIPRAAVPEDCASRRPIVPSHSAPSAR